MKANEFRIGNLVNTSERAGRWYQICRQGVIRTINNDSCNITPIKCISPVITVKFKNIDPIPLTEEWLLKFGFNNINSKEYGIKCGSCWMSLSNPKDMGEWQDYYCWIFDRFKFIELKYVHQLQNLYFALTGNELEINKEDENK